MVKAFAAGWVKAWAPDGKPAEAAALTDNPATFGPRLDDVDTALVAQSATVTPQGEPNCADDSNCTQDLAVEAVLRGIGTMKWTSTATVVKTGDAWKIKASGDTIYPGLGEANYLKRVRTVPARASILDRTGKPLTANRPVVIVGVASGNKATAATYAAFTKNLDVDGTKLWNRAKAAPAGQFVDAITIRAEEWDTLRPKMGNLPGVLTMGGTQSLPESSTFARSVIGTMKTATAETLKNAGPTASSQDQVGTTGLQYSMQQQLAGTPGGQVNLRDGKTKMVIKEVFKQEGKAGTPVQHHAGHQPAARRRGRAGHEQAARVAGRRTGFDRSDPGRGERPDRDQLQPRLPGPLRAGLDVQDRHVGGADGRRADPGLPAAVHRTRSTSSASRSRTTTASRRTATARWRRRSTSPATPRSSPSTDGWPRTG